ncbi:MAG: cytochrome c biogenesis protein [Opitutales bacterium]
MKKWIPWIIVAIFALKAIDGLIPKKPDSEFDLDIFGKLPVQLSGRIQPLDSAARNNLLLIAKRSDLENKLSRDTQMVPDQPDGYKMSAKEWLLNLAMRPEYADTLRVFKIEFPDDLGLVGLKDVYQGKRYYSFVELQPYLQELQDRVGKIDRGAPKLNPIDEQLLKLWSSLGRYDALSRSLNQGFGLDTVTEEYSAYVQVLPAVAQEIVKKNAGEQFNEELVNQFGALAQRYQQLSQSAMIRIIPTDPDTLKEVDWKNIGEALLAVTMGEPLHPYVMEYGSLTESFRKGDVEAFNLVVNNMKHEFEVAYPDEITHVHVEYWFNQAAPFTLAIVLYIAVFVLTLLSWLLKDGSAIWKSAFWISVIAFTIHTMGILVRMYIHGRPPVTNLYSSAIFVGWGSTLLCILFERFWRNGIGIASASLIGWITLIVAQGLAMDGDTLEMMRAVLDSNFWLATHVIVITFGYSATFVAGFIGIFFLVKGIFSTDFDTKAANGANSMVYGIICFAALFSLVGTILGGIWADQSWGRFWGWDPKENGALLIVIWCAIILHVRWGGLAKPRGIMVLCIFGNIVTAWSWFGTNLLGVGLHSYGFTDNGFTNLVMFVASQAACMGLALVPYAYWRSPYGKRMAKRSGNALEAEPKMG